MIVTPSSGILSMRFQNLLRVTGHIHPFHKRCSRAGREQAADHPDGRGLAGAVASEKAEDLSLLDRDGEIVDGSESAERFGEMSRLDSGHSYFSRDCSGRTGSSRAPRRSVRVAVAGGPSTPPVALFKFARATWIWTRDWVRSSPARSKAASPSSSSEY